RMAAELGHAGGQFRMGTLHEAGSGVEQNAEQAYAWFRLAAAQGSEPADQSLARVALTLDPDELAAAQALSRTYWDLYVAPFQAI
ncbi:MAG: SEL1-like repeat protein, partial [Alphaproteobacteria bacterium]|nr:SEL1-like repeat protein [Alphaproteobacteria bacterium]